MPEKYYALIGNCKMDPTKNRGLTVCEYLPEASELVPIENAYPALNVGCQLYHNEINTVYVADEFWSLHGQTGGGGNVASLKLNLTTGKLQLNSLKRTFATNPSYICADKSGKYLLAVHHTTEQFVTRTIVAPDGSISSETLYDDCTILVYRLNSDGSVGGICDILKIPGVDGPHGHRWPHLHQILPDPSGRFYLVNDKGLGKIYVFSLTDGKLLKVSEADAAPGTEPRYGVFSPDGKCYIINHENNTALGFYDFDCLTGALRKTKQLQTVPMPENGANPMAGDILMHPNGRRVYSTYRTDNLLAVAEIYPDGTAKHIQTIDCGGNHPRGLGLSPDGKTLFVLNSGSGTIDAFRVQDDGTLRPDKRVYSGGYPANMQIIRGE